MIQGWKFDFPLSISHTVGLSSVCPINLEAADESINRQSGRSSHMALADNRVQRISTLCALYLAQGIPWGFMDITLVNYLIDNDIKPGDAAKVASFILLPWAFKLIWAPLIDTVTIRSMGRRRSWSMVVVEDG